MEFRIYIAGQLNNRADINKRIEERKAIDAVIEELGLTGRVRVFNPIESPVNFKDDLPSTEKIFNTDYDEMLNADVLFFDISTDDTGTMVELGIMVEKFIQSPLRYTLLPVIDDCHVDNAGHFDGFDVPRGWNSFMVGAARRGAAQGKIYSSFEDALEVLKLKLINQFELNG